MMIVMTVDDVMIATKMGDDDEDDDDDDCDGGRYHNDVGSVSTKKL